MLVRVAHHPGHSGQSRYLIWSALRVAPGDQNAAIWIGALHPADRSAGIFICARSDCARVQHDDFRVVCFPRALQSAIEKLAFDGSPICLSRAAAKILYVEAGHTSILNDTRAAVEV